jgi:hypothetical protein
MKRWSSFLLVPAFLLVTACDDDSTDPGDGIDLDVFIGTYALDPSPQVTCDLGDFGEAVVTIDTVEVTDASADSLFLRVPFVVTNDFFGAHDAEAEFGVAVTGEDGFAGDSPLEMSVPVGPTTVSGDGLVALDGEFISDDTFSAEIIAAFNVQVGNGTPIPCEAGTFDVTGTRAD